MTLRATRRARSAPAFALALAAAAALSLLAWAPAAGARVAHGGDGVIEVEAAHPTSTGVHFIVRLTYQNDGDPVSGATVTATAVGPGGQETDPVELSPSDAGGYQGPVDMPEPGEWTVRFRSADPPATLEQATEIPEAASGDETGGEAGGTPATDEGFAPAEDGTGGSGAAGEDDSGSDGLPVLLIVAAAVVAVGGLFTGLRIVRRTHPATPDPIPPAPAGDEGGGEGS
jgi:hypothetical protein